jgi:hypothetical protein
MIAMTTVMMIVMILILTMNTGDEDGEDDANGNDEAKVADQMPNDGMVNPEEPEVLAKIAGVENNDQIAQQMDAKYGPEIMTST